MGEALIWYRGRDTIDPELLKPTTITNNGNYTAPITGTYTVYSVGGGGGGGGGCRNAWNVSQIFHGSAGTRGTLNTVMVNLNQGDNIVCIIGAGGSAGTNNTTRTSYTNGTYNSRGTNGAAGGATSFGSYGSGTGGTGGRYSWSRTYWTNTNLGWNNQIEYQYKLQWFNTFYNYLQQEVYYSGSLRAWFYNNTYAKILNRSTGAVVNYTNVNYVTRYDVVSSNRYIYQNGEYSWREILGYNKSDMKCLISINSYWAGMWGNTSYWSSSSNTSASGIYTAVYKFWCASNRSNSKWDISGAWQGLYEGIAWMTINQYGYQNVPSWNNKIKWSNTISNTSTRCYTSIQTGSWWYLNNNAVTTSGSRLYRGDGGNSGRPGNAGYILVVPPSSVHTTGGSAIL